MGMRIIISVCAMLVAFSVSIKMMYDDLCRQENHRVIYHELSFILALLTAILAGMHLEYYYFRELNSTRYTCEVFIIMGVYIGLSLLITLLRKKKRMTLLRTLSLIPIVKSNKITRNAGQCMNATDAFDQIEKKHNVKRKWSAKRGH